LCTVPSLLGGGLRLGHKDLRLSREGRGKGERGGGNRSHRVSGEIPPTARSKRRHDAPCREASVQEPPPQVDDSGVPAHINEHHINAKKPRSSAWPTLVGHRALHPGETGGMVLRWAAKLTSAK
jgi:hypothetical protein